MKNLITIAIAFIALGLTGCGQKQEVKIPTTNNSSKEYLKINSATKVYYKDLVRENVIKANERLVEELNKEEIIPSKWHSVKNPEKTTSYFDARFTTKENTSKQRVSGGKFVLSEKGLITYDKAYTSAVEFSTDVENIYTYIKESLNKKVFRDTFLTSSIVPDVPSLKNNKFAFATKYTYLYNSVQNNIRLTIELGGWQMVDSPEKADKEIYFDLSRDYFTKELNDLKKENKGIKFTSLESDSNFNTSDNKNYNNGSHIVVGQSAMSAASNSNSDLTSAAIGLGVSAIFSIFGNSSSKKEESGSFASLRVIDKINKTDNIKVYDTFIDSHKPELYQNISETINIDPDNKKYNIKGTSKNRVKLQIIL